MKRDRPHYRIEQVQLSRFHQDLDDFTAWLEANAYSPRIVRQHLLRLDRTLGDMPASPGGTYSSAKLQRAFGKHNRTVSRLVNYRGTQHCFERFLASQGRLLVPNRADRFTPLRERYYRHLVELRGFSASSLAQHTSTVTAFLNRGARSCRTLEDLTRADVEQFVVLKSAENKRHSMQHVIAHLRAFLRYCFDQGDICVRLDVIDTPRTYRGELPPRALPWPAIKSLLGCIDRRGKAGRRDYAVLHLMAYYGLRPGEVAGLRLDSVDWLAGTLRVEQRKTHSALMLPLAARTVRALIDYLDHERGDDVNNHPTLFLGIRCPVGPMRNTAIGAIFKRRALQSGLNPQEYSAYSLRHAFAMRLLTQGVGIKVIGDVLGHRNLESTCAYLRLDIDALRDVALDVPSVDGVHGGRHA